VRKIIKIVILLLFISGCSSIKQGYRNFTAYYNTFYNTKQYYDDGLRLNQRQSTQLNPNQAVRIHQAPTNAGLDDFQNAIETGSSILRDHMESKYLQPALFIIGKSYYYRSEFFSALQKFQEYEALSDGRERQEAIFWQGLTYLEMLNFEVGIDLLESEIEAIPDWDPEILAETKAVLGQLYYQMGEYRRTIDYLEEAIPFINHQEKKSRAFFLLGQSLESLELPEQALYAYRAISQVRSSFEIDYHSNKKEAELSRELGYYEEAERLFRRMSRDSKYLTYQNELLYEIARTQQLKGDYEEAISSYNQVIDDRYQTPGPVTLAKTYYGLGEIYRDYFEDYTRAAYFFEQSAAQRVNVALLPNDFDANELAVSFGRYAELKSQISENDSLLVLANMSDDELKDFISELQRTEQERLDQETRGLRREQDRVALPVDELPVELTAESEFGFLNSNNRSKQVEASLQFQSIWGDRSIADNWRRSETVSGTRFERVVVRGAMDEEIDLQQSFIDPSIRNVIELSNIPFSEDEQISIQRETENFNYQLGNVFFLTLNMPDSAKIYYEKVIDSGFEKDLVTMSMFSLAELELSLENISEAFNWYDSLVDYNPGSRYTSQLASRLDVDNGSFETEEAYSTASEYSQLIDNEENLAPANRAERILEIAERAESESGRVRLYLDAAYEYMKAAQNEMGSSDLIQNWMLAQSRFEMEKSQFEERQELSREMLSDSTLNESEREYWLSIQELSTPEPNFNAEFPYIGAYWDSTRSVLARIEVIDGSSPLMARVRALDQELQLPETDLRFQDASETIAQISPPDSPPGNEQSDLFQSVSNQVSEDSEITGTDSQLQDEETALEADSVEADSVEEESTIPDSVAETTINEGIIVDDPLITDYSGEDSTEEGIQESYSIVLYSFSNEEAAYSTANELEEFGYGVYICPRIIDNSSYFRVSIGSFSEIRNAIQVSRILEDPYNAQNFISSINSTCRIISLPGQETS
tara:strand:- start:26993 stop:29962 length:2970 start_codon:yes stop_codon:yes gene_type:complete